MIEDFTARRRAAIEAKRLLLEEMKAEDELNYQIDCAVQEFENWIERERVKRVAQSTISTRSAPPG
jgi:hypothetical protein